MRAPELLQQAELLKPNVVGENGDVEWQIRLELQHLLENVLITDLDYAISRQVEQTLWNFCFKNCIDVYQNRLRRRKNDSDVARLQLFLDACIGYFTQLLGRLCREYNLQLNCYKSDAALGILNGHFRDRKKAQTTAINCVTQFCLVHLGDIARYQKNIEEAENFYTQAWSIQPDNGHALNQLAILETSGGRHLPALCLYTRSLYVRNPFQLAAGNIEKFCDSIETGADLKTYLSSFFRLYSFVHNCRRLDEAERILKTLSKSTVNAYENEEINARDMEHMVVVIIGEIWKITSLSDDCLKVFAAAVSRFSPSLNNDSTPLAFDELRCLRILVDSLRELTVAAMDLFSRKVDDFDSTLLGVLKLTFDFLTLHPEVFSVRGSDLQEATVRFLHALANFLNQLQTVKIYRDERCGVLDDDVPLHEDERLRGFLPLEKIHINLDFDAPHKTTDLKELYKTRIQRLVAFGVFTFQRLKNSELFSAHESSDGGGKWTFSAKVPEERPSRTPSISPDSAVTTKPSNLVKRQTKVVPLISILEREKVASADVQEDESATASAKMTSTKTVRIKTPEPFEKNSPSPAPVSAASTSISDPAPPLFQAARLKQALTGEGKMQHPPPLNFIPPRWDEQQQRAPFGGPFSSFGAPPFRQIRPPLMIPPPMPMMGIDQMDAGGFHRTPGVRPPGPAPFPPPPPVFTTAPPRFSPMPPPWSTTAPSGTWNLRPPASTAAPSLYLGRNEDPYNFRVWETQQRPRQFGPAMGQPMRNTGDDIWRNVGWSRSDGVDDPSSGGIGNITSTPPPGFENSAGDTGAMRRMQRQDFSLFGIDSPWEYASDRLLSQGKDGM